MSSTLPPVWGVDLHVLPQAALGHALHVVELLRSANLMARLRRGRHAPRLGWRLVDLQGHALPPSTGPLAPWATTARSLSSHVRPMLAASAPVSAMTLAPVSISMR